MLELSHKRRNIRRNPVRWEWQDGARRAILRTICHYRFARIDDPLKLRLRYSRVLGISARCAKSIAKGIVAWHAGKISAGAYQMRIYARWGSVQSQIAAQLHTYSVRPRRRRSLFYVPSVLYCCVRVLRDRTNGSNDREVWKWQGLMSMEGSSRE